MQTLLAAVKEVYCIPSKRCINRYSDTGELSQSKARMVEASGKKGKGSPYSITERRVPELIPVLGS